MRLECIQYLYDERRQETVSLQQETILILKAVLLGGAVKSTIAASKPLI